MNFTGMCHCAARDGRVQSRAAGFQLGLQNRAGLHIERLPALPRPDDQTFDPGLIVSRHWEEVQGRQVPVVMLRGRDGGFAKIYAFRSTQFDLKGLKSEQGVVDSNCQAMYFPTERSSVVYVVVFTGRDLAQFLTQQIKPGANGVVLHFNRRTPPPRS